MDASGLTPDIVHVVNSVEHGGAERVVLDLAGAQHGRLGRCEVICLHGRGALEEEFARRGIPVTLIATPACGAWTTAWQLAGLLQARRPRVVHAHNVAPQIAVALGRRMRRWGDVDTRLVYTEHGRLADARHRILWLRRRLGRDYHAVVGVSEDVRRQLLSLGIGRPDRTRTITNGVDLSRFPKRPTVVATEGHHVVTIGRLSQIKGQDILLKAVALARPRLGALTVTLVGDGPTRPALEAQVAALGLEGVVRLTGARQDVRGLLAAADLFVLPSRSEGVSLALLEAMATGLPIVATAVGGTVEVTGPGRGGRLVPAESPEAMAQAMVELLGNRELMAAEGEAARHRVEEAFSLDRTLAAYAECYGLGMTA